MERKRKEGRKTEREKVEQELEGERFQLLPSADLSFQPKRNELFKSLSHRVSRPECVDSQASLI